jgi:release factor glutamine methyltransferase
MHLGSKLAPVSMTLREALATAIRQLETNALLRDCAAQDGNYLLRHALGISQASLIANDDRLLTGAEQTAYEALIARRMTCEPVQYITGEREFYGLPLRVSPAVLIPRNATEHLVEAVLEEMTPRAEAGEMLRLVDVGTGSGAIAIALAQHLPNAEMTALDLSREALELAASNAAFNAAGERIRFLESDLLNAVECESSFDAVVSNPPYVPLCDREKLHPQVRDFEPAGALFAGADGLDIYRRLVPQAWGVLKQDGLLAMEIGFGQAEAMRVLLAGWQDVRFVDDLEQIPRVVLARRR